MKKAILVGFLLVFAWTSVVGAQDAGTETESSSTVPAFMDFLLALPRTTDQNRVDAFNGYGWRLFSQDLKAVYVKAFLTAAHLVADYAWAVVRSRPTSGDTALGDYLWGLGAYASLSQAAPFRFRVGVYVIELDALYEDWANCNIPVMEAMYIADERLNGREVDLTAWRNKGKQEGT